MKTTHRFITAAMVIGLAVPSFAQFASNKVRLLKQIPLAQFAGLPTSGSGCAGYVSPSGKEYAIMGLRNGNAVVDISNPINPVIIGHIPGVVSQWHEVCVLGNYAYATTEGGGGIQIINLSRLEENPPVVELAATYTGNDLSSGHTIQAVPEKNLVIVHGSNTISGLRILDCTNPTQPVQVGTWNTKYVHDAIYKTYTSGPDAGKTICFAFCANGTNGGMYVIDITNPATPTQIGFIRYLMNGTNFYSHSGSMSPDGRYILLNDELDEVNNLVPVDCTTHIIDIQNLTAPTYAGSFGNPIDAIDHNSMVQDGHLFLSAYKAGMRVYDVRNTPTITEAGFFDTHTGTGLQFAGDWGVWANFPSGNVIISDMNAGLIIVDPSEAKGLGAPITNWKLQHIPNASDADKRLRKADGNAFAVDFTTAFSEMLVGFQTTSTSRSKIDITLRARSRNNRQERMSIWASRKGNKPLLVGEFVLTSAYADYTIPNLSGPLHLETDGTFELTIGFQKGAAGDGAVDLDMAKISVHN
jgi:choice-of-anchor B domain-containing protein